MIILTIAVASTSQGKGQNLWISGRVGSEAAMFHTIDDESDDFHDHYHDDWLVVSTHLKNISQNDNLPQIGVNIKHI